jgi:hypothetical protein
MTTLRRFGYSTVVACTVLGLAAPVTVPARASRTNHTAQAPRSATVLASTTLPLTNLFDLEIDNERSVVYLSGGTTDAVLAVNFDGVVVETLGGVPGAAGMAIVENVLYVAARRGSWIQPFDLATSPPTALDALDISPLRRPGDLVYAGGRLWFGARRCGARRQVVAGIRPDGSGLRRLSREDDPAWQDCASLDGGFSVPDRLFVSTIGLSPDELRVYDVSSARPSLVAKANDFGHTEDDDVEPLRSGRRFLMADATGNLGLYGVGDLTGPTFTYLAPGAAHLGGAVDMNPQAGLVAATAHLQVWIWQRGDQTHVGRYEFSPLRPGTAIYRRGLAFTPDGQRLLVLTGRGDGIVRLRVLDPTPSN